jgi:hypothetical protein
MFEAADIAEFPFVAGLPKRERSRLENMWDQMADLRAIVASKGMLIPSRLAAKILGISRQRVEELLKEGRLELVQVEGHNFIPESSVVAYARSERKAGRPVKSPDSPRECFTAAREYGREVAGKQ